MIPSIMQRAIEASKASRIHHHGHHLGEPGRALA
jgi:hypothetical protein